MITSSGLICDVCGKYIFPLFHTEESFNISGNDFSAHSECIPIVKKMVAVKDFKILPMGPLRSMYESQEPPTIK